MQPQRIDSSNVEGWIAIEGRLDFRYDVCFVSVPYEDDTNISESPTNPRKREKKRKGKRN